MGVVTGKEYPNWTQPRNGVAKQEYRRMETKGRPDSITGQRIQEYLRHR